MNILIIIGIYDNTINKDLFFKLDSLFKISAISTINAILANIILPCIIEPTILPNFSLSSLLIEHSFVADIKNQNQQTFENIS